LINREIFRLAIPNILSNISVPLLSTVDTALMGHLDTASLAAVGIAGMIFNLIYWNFGFLRMGTTGMSAQAYGQNDNLKISYTLYRALFLSSIIAIVLLMFQNYLLSFLSEMMNIKSGYYTLVEEYFSIRIYAAPATLGLYVLFGWFFGMQNAFIPLILTIFINIINIALSYYFVNVMDLKISGVAYGTLIAQYSGFILALFYLLKYKERLLLLKVNSLFDSVELVKYLHINRDIFIRTVALTFAFAFFYSQSAKEGEMALAISVILLQFLSWISFGIDGFAYAAESLVGKYYGAKQWDKFNEVVRCIFYWGFALALFYTLIYYFKAEWIVTLFTSDKALLSEIKPYLFWTMIMSFAGIVGFIFDGIFIGMTASKSMRDSIIISLVLFLILFYALEGFHSLHLYWFSFMMFLFLRGVIQSWMFYMRGRELR
jgi:MATE family multidrug resistance protein